MTLVEEPDQGADDHGVIEAPRPKPFGPDLPSAIGCAFIAIPLTMLPLVIAGYWPVIFLGVGAIVGVVAWHRAGRLPLRLRRDGDALRGLPGGAVLPFGQGSVVYEMVDTSGQYGARWWRARVSHEDDESTIVLCSDTAPDVARAFAYAVRNAGRFRLVERLTTGSERVLEAPGEKPQLEEHERPPSLEDLVDAVLAPVAEGGPGRCPHDDTALEVARGELMERPCPKCAGRFLERGGAERLFEHELAIARELLSELARATPRQGLACSGCGMKMTPAPLKGVEVNLCRGCGGVWLDAGELTRLSAGRYQG